MGDRYWVRHASFSSGFAGPLSSADLRAAVLAGSLPRDARVRLAAAGGQPEVLDERQWSPVHELLGLEPPPPPPVPEPVIPLPPPGVPGVRPEQVLADVRERSAYEGARNTLTFLSVLAALGIGLVTLVAVFRARQFELAFVALVQAVVAQAAVYLVRQAFLMLADIADCHLRRETERAARSLAPSPARN